MNESYVVPEINRENSTVKSDTNVLNGFKQSAKNGQSRLAIDYLVYVVDILVKKVEALEAQIAASAAPAPQPKAAKTAKAEQEEA